jgi:hypothetical protein
MKTDIFKNRIAKIILGLLWGFGLAVIFRYACLGKKCVIYKSPVPATIKNNIYSFDEKCYQYKQVNTKCTKDAIESN